MSSNKKSKEELIRRYGAECFIDKLQLRKDDKPRHYTGQGQMARMKQLTYHHIKMKKDGGPATIENGALLSAENHAWFNQQSEQDQARMNALFQEYKRQIDEKRKHYQECKIVLVDDLDLDFQIRAMEFHIDDREQAKMKYNRAKTKQEFMRQIREDEER